MKTTQTLEKYIERNLKERNGAEGLDVDALKSRMKKGGYDLTKPVSDYENVSDVIYKEITGMMIERNVLERQKNGDLTIEEIYPLVRESVSFHSKALGEHDIEDEDIVQNVMIKVYNNWESFRGESRVTTWVYRIVRNEVINMIIYQNRHKRKAAGIVSIEQEGFETLDDQGSLLDMLIYEELTEEVVSYVESITDDPECDPIETNVLEYFLLGIDNKCIARTFDLKPVQVKEILQKHHTEIKKIVLGENECQE